MRSKKVSRWSRYIDMLLGMQDIGVTYGVDPDSRSIRYVPSEMGNVTTFSLRTDRNSGLTSQHGPQGEIKREFHRTN